MYKFKVCEEMKPVATRLYGTKVAPDGEIALFDYYKNKDGKPWDSRRDQPKPKLEQKVSSTQVTT